MDFDLLPVDETMQVLRTEPDGKLAFSKILEFAQKNMPSEIWNEFKNMNIEKDI